MYDDYLKAVLAAYEKKKEDRTLSSNLSHPTPAKLRNECMIVHRERPFVEDDIILRVFFKATDKEKGYTKSIDNFDIDGFRPLINILRGRVNSPGVKYIDLLAWLIDFKSRPSALYYKHIRDNSTTNPVVLSPAEEPTGEIVTIDDTPEDDNATTNPIVLNPVGESTDEIVVDETIQDDKQTGKDKAIFGLAEIDISKPVKNKNLQKSFMITCIVFFIAGISTFLLWEYFTGATGTPAPDENCMYWTGNHYEPINCNEKVGYLPIIPLDTKKLHRLKKINWPDRLTKDALGRVWYSSVGGEYEFFTDSGMHPIDTVKRLRPLTSYILTNHVSYHRYLLTVLVWAIGTVVLFILCLFSLNYFVKTSRK